MTEAERIEKTHPDFPQWIHGEDGKSCMLWPISEQKYLHNRLFWAFDAGRNCVWQQYITQKAENERLQQLIKDYEFQTGVTENNRLETIKDLRSELKSAQELNRELVEGLQYALERLNDFDYKSDSYIESLINKSK